MEFKLDRQLMSRKIYHRYDTRPALISMGLSAKRLLFMCLAQLGRDSKKSNVLIKFNSNDTFIITATDYAYLCDISHLAA